MGGRIEGLPLSYTSDKRCKPSRQSRLNFLLTLVYLVDQLSYLFGVYFEYMLLVELYVASWKCSIVLERCFFFLVFQDVSLGGGSFITTEVTAKVSSHKRHDTNEMAYKVH